MTIPVAQAAVDDLQAAHRALLAVVDGLTEEQWERAVPYGEWTVKDLVAHVIGDLSPSGPGLILAGILTPEFISETAKTFDVRGRNASMVAERQHFTREDLRQLLFESHDAFIDATLRLEEQHLPVLAYKVPMGAEYDLTVGDWLWFGHHDRQHADDIRRATEVDYAPEHLAYISEIEMRMRAHQRAHDGLMRAIYSVAEDAWEEQSAEVPGWTFHDILAHVSSNEARRRLRLLSAVVDESEVGHYLATVNDIDGWNAEQVSERKGWPVQKLVDELVLGWYEIRKVLAQFKPEHLRAEVRLGGDRKMSATEFLERMAGHTSTHAGQLVPASRARRFAGKG
jgi:hypothetical protein